MRPSLHALSATVLLLAGCATPRDYWGEGLPYKHYRLGNWEVTCSRFDSLVVEDEVACRASQTVNGAVLFIQRQPRNLEVSAYFKNCSTGSGFEIPLPRFTKPAPRGAELMSVVADVVVKLQECGIKLDAAALDLNITDMDQFLDQTDDLQVSRRAGKK